MLKLFSKETLIGCIIGSFTVLYFIFEFVPNLDPARSCVRKVFYIFTLHLKVVCRVKVDIEYKTVYGPSVISNIFYQKQLQHARSFENPTPHMKIDLRSFELKGECTLHQYISFGHLHGQKSVEAKCFIIISHSIDSLYSTNSVNVYVPSDNQQFRYKIARGW